MAPLAFVNGELLAADQAVLSVFDHGLVVGDGVFETVLVRHGRPVLLGRHLERLAASAAGLGLEPPDPAVVTAAAEQVLGSEELALGRLRITYTAGPGPLGSGRRAVPRSLVVLAEAADPAPASCRVAVVPWTRNERGALAGLKTTSYAENARALAWAAGQGADEAIFANTAGNLCEGTGSNVFVVLRRSERDGAGEGGAGEGGAGDAEVLTPPLTAGCLAGVTRSLALQCGASEGNVAIDDFRAEHLLEAFLTSTVRGVQPIAAIDGAALASCPGPATAAIAERFDKLRAEG
jgi:branched-chain amino acid aminotransferase